MVDGGAWFERAAEARRAGRTTDARRALVEVAELAKEGRDDATLVRAINGLAQLDRDENRPMRALPRYEAALRVARASADEPALAHTARHLGELLVELGRLDEAESHLTEALAIVRKSEPAGLPLANAVRPVALLREAQGKEDEARSLWTEARTLYEQAEVQAGVEECDAHLGGAEA